MDYYDSLAVVNFIITAKEDQKMKLRFVRGGAEVPGVFSFYFEPPAGTTWIAGQFLHYTLPHPSVDERGVKRWFTISTAPYENLIRITTRINSEKSSSFKTALQQLKEGDEVEAEAPEGDFVFGDPGKKYVFFAGGIGITPFRSILAQLEHDGQDFKVDLLYANRTDELVFGGELRALEQKYPDFHIHEFIGGHNVTLDDLKPYMDDPNTIIYISGPEPMVEDFDRKLKDAGLPEERVKGDYFPNYPTY
jgi:ferredoxin-NADP reductase